MTTPARARAHLRPKIPHEKPKFARYYRQHGEWGPFEHIMVENMVDDVAVAGALFEATERVDAAAVKMAQVLKRMSIVQRRKMRLELKKELGFDAE